MKTKPIGRGKELMMPIKCGGCGNDKLTAFLTKGNEEVWLKCPKSTEWVASFGVNDYTKTVLDRKYKFYEDN